MPSLLGDDEFRRAARIGLGRFSFVSPLLPVFLVGDCNIPNVFEDLLLLGLELELPLVAVLPLPGESCDEEPRRPF